MSASASISTCIAGSMRRLAHLHHRGGRADAAEEVAVSARDRFPVRDVGHVYPRADNVADRRVCLSQGRLDIEQRLDGLRVGVAGSYH